MVNNHHDLENENETSTGTAEQREQANVLPSRDEYSAEIYSADENGDASEAHHE